MFWAKANGSKASRYHLFLSGDKGPVCNTPKLAPSRNHRVKQPTRACTWCVLGSMGQVRASVQMTRGGSRALAGRSGPLWRLGLVA